MIRSAVLLPPSREAMALVAMASGIAIHAQPVRIDVGHGAYATRSAGCELAREELERRPRLGLLLARKIDPVPGEVDARLGGDLDGLVGQALGGELEDARAVRVEPHLRDHL